LHYFKIQLKCKDLQSVAVEAPVLFDLQKEVNCLCLQPNSSDVKINEEGIYKVLFIGATNVACQFAIFVNGVSHDSTINGVNGGAGQVSIHALLKFNKGDLVSVVNHTSGSAVDITTNPGGVLAGNSVLLELIKIAPLTPCTNH
jgi:hypothetical protein